MCVRNPSFSSPIIVIAGPRQKPAGLRTSNPSAGVRSFAISCFAEQSRRKKGERGHGKTHNPSFEKYKISWFPRYLPGSGIDRQFCKGSGSKQLRSCRPFSLCCNYLTLKQAQTRSKQICCIPIKFFYMNNYRPDLACQDV